MKLSCTSWSFPACTLDEAAGIARALGVGALDVGIDYRAALDRRALLETPAEVARQVRSLGLSIPCFYYRFGDSLAQRNIAASQNHQQNLADFRQIMTFCQSAEIPTVFILPGIVNPGQSTAQAIDQAVRALGDFLPLAEAAGVCLTIEAHVQSCFESPALVLELLNQVPGLRLTLDYSHFICLGYRQEEIDPLAPFAAHVHLRQARPGVLQAKLDQGTINFPALFSTLREVGYDGWLALENVHQAYMNTLYDDVLTETVRLRDLARAYL